MTRYAGKRYNKSPTGTAKGTDAQNPIQAPQKPDFLQVDRDGSKPHRRTDGRKRPTAGRETQSDPPPGCGGRPKPLTLPKILAKFSAKSRPVARNIWKNRELVSEIPRWRRNRTKNILEMGTKSPRTEEERGKMGLLSKERSELLCVSTPCERQARAQKGSRPLLRACRCVWLVG